MKSFCLLRTLLIIAVPLIIMPACSGTEPQGHSANENTLPWQGTFIAPPPDSGAAQKIASALEAEMHTRVPDTIRRFIAGYVNKLVADSNRNASAIATKRRLQSGAPPQYEFYPKTESEAFNMAGVSYVFQGSWAAGAWSFSCAVQRSPDDPLALNQLGWALLADKRYNEAEDLLLRALELEPDLWSAWSSLGYLYEKTGDWLRAVYCYRRSLGLHPQSVFVYLKLGRLLLEHGDINGASYSAGVALALSPDNAEAKTLGERIESLGGEVPELLKPVGGVTSDAGRAVFRNIDDCLETNVQWMANVITPYILSAINEGMIHRDKLAAAGNALTQCDQLCQKGPSDNWEDCHFGCQVSYCANMYSAIGEHYHNRLHFLVEELGFAASMRSRFQACAYSAIEARQRDLSQSEIMYLVDYIDWQVTQNRESYRNAINEEYADYLQELSGPGSICSAPRVIEVIGDSNEVIQRPPLFDEGMEACADGFICLSFGETSVGFSVGVGIASGGLTADYGTDDLIFSLGAGPDFGAAAFSFDAKLSIQRGFGLSSTAKFGGPIRATIGRDYWLFSF